MAENKNSFILYCDLIHTVEQMPDDKAGLLFKHILRYVNDKNPVTDDLIIQLTFEPVKQQLKRDLQKYYSICDRNKENGKKGGRPVKQEYTENPEEPKKPSGLFGNPEEPKKPDSDNGSVTDTVIVKRKRNKINFIAPTLTEVENYFIENGYTKESAKRAFTGYSVADWIDSHGNKVRNWKQKMNHVWFKEENKIYTEKKKQA